MKPFLTIAQQVKLLKSRGLVIANETEAGEYLLSNNYYNIINGYGKYFTQGSIYNTTRKHMTTTRLQNNLHSISPNRILATLGFPDDWFSTVGGLPQGEFQQRR